MELMSLLGSAIKPVANLIDELHTSEEEKLTLHNKLAMGMESMAGQIMQFVTAQIKAQKEVLQAEIQGKSWLQRNWRPMLMCLFGVIIANNYILNPWLDALFDLDVKMDIPPDMWALLKLGIGGYVAGRSVEKTIGPIVKIITDKRE